MITQSWLLSDNLVSGCASVLEGGAVFTFVGPPRAVSAGGTQLRHSIRGCHHIERVNAAAGADGLTQRHAHIQVCLAMDDAGLSNGGPASSLALLHPILSSFLGRMPVSPIGYGV